MGTIAINPPPSPPANNLPASYLVITATNSSGGNVPIQAQISGGLGGTGGYIISLRLPEDSATRNAKEQAFIDHAKATDTVSSAKALAYVNQHNAQAVAAIDRVYAENQVGAFHGYCLLR